MSKLRGFANSVDSSHIFLTKFWYSDQMSSRNIFTPLYLKAEASSHYSWLPLRGRCPYSELFWSVFSRIWTVRRDISSVRIRENTDQNNFEYGHFLRSVLVIKQLVITILYIICVNILTWYHLGTYIVDTPWKMGSQDDVMHKVTWLFLEFFKMCATS